MCGCMYQYVFLKEFIFQRPLFHLQKFIADKFCRIVLPFGSSKCVSVQRGQRLRDLKNAECPGSNPCSLLQAEM